MTKETVANDKRLRELSEADWARLEEIVDRFESAWEPNSPSLLNQFLPAHSDSLRPTALFELSLTELELQMRHSDSFRVEDLARRYPELTADADTMLALIAREFDIRRRRDPAVSHREYQDRFPEHWDRFNTSSRSTKATAGIDEGETVAGAFGEAANHKSAHQKIAHFELLENVGSGAFANVWRARDLRLNRIVALKVPRPGLFTSDQRAQFLREAQAAAKLNHPGIVAIYELGEDDGIVYIASEFVEGTPLTEQVAGLGVTDSVVLCRRIAQALEHAHRSGVTHRDLKPANILIDERGEPRLTDFGLAKYDESPFRATLEGDLIGTPAYMSPEQAKGMGHASDARTDVYSLGVVLFELLSGELPFRGNMTVLLERIATEDPPNLQEMDRRIPTDLQTICQRCLQKNANQRYQSARDLEEDLRRWLEHEPIKARPVGRFEKAWRWSQRRPLVASLFAVILVVTVTGFAGVTWQWREAVSARNAEAKQRRHAVDAKLDAERKQAQLEEQYSVATAYRLAAQSREVRYSHPRRSLLLASESMRRVPPSNPVVFSAVHQNLRDALQAIGGDPLLGHKGVVYRCILSHDRSRVFSCAEDGVVAIWNISNLSFRRNAMRKLIQHSTEIVVLERSADEKRLVAGGADGRIWLWTMSNDSQKIQRLIPSSLQGRLSAASFSSDGKWLAVGSRQGHVGVWKLDEQSVVAELQAELTLDAGVAALLFNNDGALLICGGDNGVLSVWQTPFGAVEPIRSTAHQSAVTHLSIAGQNRLVSASSDGEIRQWSVNPLHSLITLRGDSEGIQSLAVSPDGCWVATGCWDGACRVWKLTPSETHAVPITLRGHQGVVGAVCFTSDSQRLVSGSDDKTVRIWRFTDDEPLQSPLVLRGHEAHITDLSVGNEDRSLVSASGDGTLRYWDVASSNGGAAPKTLLLGADSVSKVAISGDGKWLVVGSSKLQSRRQSIGVYNLSATPSKDSRLPIEATTLIALSPDELWLAICGKDNVLRLRDVRRPSSEAVILGSHKAAITHLVFSPDSRLLLSSSFDGASTLWNVSNRPSLQQPLQTKGVSALNGHFGKTGRWIATEGLDQQIQLWRRDQTEGHFQRLRTSTDSVARIVGFSHHDRWLVAQRSNGQIALWDLTADDPINGAIGLTSEESAQVLAMSPQGRFLVAGDEVGKAYFWRLDHRSPDQTRVILDGHHKRIVTASIDRSESLLVTGGLDHDARLWSLTRDASPRLVAVMRQHQGPVLQTAISSTGRWIATGSHDGETCLWERRGQTRESQPVILRGNGSPILSLAFAKNDHWLASASRDGTVRAWDLRFDNLADLAESVAGRQLTEEERSQFLLAE